MRKILIIFATAILTFVVLFNLVLFPLKYKNEIKENASQYNIDPVLIASLINVESSFNEKAVSNKGAIGLMQLMPETANWISLIAFNEEITNEILITAPKSIKIGTYYLKYLINKFNNTDVALCAYNAGEGVVLNWLNNTDYSVDGKTLNEIPYIETKKYLQKIYNNMRIYKYKI